MIKGVSIFQICQPLSLFFLHIKSQILCLIQNSHFPCENIFQKAIFTAEKKTFTKWWSQLRFMPGWEMEDSVQVVTYNWFSVVVWHYFLAPLYIEKRVLSPSKFSIYSILGFFFSVFFFSKSWWIIVRHLCLPQCRRLWRPRSPKEMWSRTKRVEDMFI